MRASEGWVLVLLVLGIFLLLWGVVEVTVWLKSRNRTKHTHHSGDPLPPEPPEEIR